MKSRKVKDRPSTDHIKQLLNSWESYSSIGRMYWVSDNAIRKWFKLADETPVKIAGESAWVEDALTWELHHKEHNELIRAKKFFTSRENHTQYAIENGKLAGLDVFKYEELKQTMSIRAIARMYNTSHGTLIKKFNSKIHQDKLINNP